MQEEINRGVPFRYHVRTFSGPKIYKTMLRHWWWDHIYQDIIDCAPNRPQCAILTGAGRRQSPSMKSTPADHPFQIIGVDIMKLPVTTRGNRYAY